VLFEEVKCVCSRDSTKHANMFWWQNADFLNITTGSVYSTGLNGGIQVLMVAVYCKNNTYRVITFRGQSVQFFKLQRAVCMAFRSKRLSSGADISDIRE